MAATLENKLYEAAEEGNVTVLLELIRQDRLLLDRVLVNYAVETPLHVAAMLGHTDFVKEIIQRKPEFTKEADSKGSSPLHLASAKGYVEIVKALLLVSPDMCLAVDKEERNPLHLAAMKGQVGVLKELVRVRPQAARVPVASGETVLHLCVKYGQFEALRLLVEVMKDHEIVNAKDEYGMSILHLAVAYKQIEIMKFLLSVTGIEVNGLNAYGLTALDVLAQSRRGLKDFEMAESLRDAGALKAAEIYNSGPRTVRLRTETTPLFARDVPTNQPAKKEDWLTRKRDSLMVVASLMATMSFQAGLTPPGGLWQDGLIQAPQGNNITNGTHEAGTSISAYRNQSYYGQYLAANTISFIASMSIILLLITGLPFKRRFFMWILTVIMWVAISAMAFTYRISLLVFTPKAQELNVTRILDYALVVWLSVMALLLLAHTVRLTVNIFQKVDHVVGTKRGPSPTLSYTNNFDI
ncbi:ankyrin repeat-containing protein BDA1-like isoform X2 [Hibiscus syriacus]|uniref:ankyrin repeat-containing protein BDA1-like isoform X2 n=1 Tax=Hibiscus syriacus TaxID=106335 RepID=UPI0019241205|nr:ankyrin repeat-containing protein BDA1-like isoform X2 [Hibiscus syriacus]